MEVMYGSPYRYLYLRYNSTSMHRQCGLSDMIRLHINFKMLYSLEYHIHEHTVVCCIHEYL